LSNYNNSDNNLNNYNSFSPSDYDIKKIPYSLEAEQSVLGAILIGAALGLMNFREVLHLRRYDRGEFRIALAAVLGVVIIGVIQGVALAVLLALIRFLSRVARPSDNVLGQIPGHDGFYELAHNPGSRPIPGLLLYRFESPLTFFNADYFRHRVLTLVAQAAAPVKWVVIDCVSITDVDYTGLMAIRRLREELTARHVRLALAGRMAEIQRQIQAWGIQPATVEISLFPSRHTALAAFRDEMSRQARMQKSE